MFSDLDYFFMSKVLGLAERYKHKTFPNPAVAALVVQKNQIIARGLHKGPGTIHAEREALNKAGAKASGSTLYVNLEPCCHFGRTPPCTDIIISSKVKRVVYSIVDPNPLVNKKATKILKKRGIEVEKGLMDRHAYLINEPFFIAQLLNRPLISLKLATSMDGFIADRNAKSKWITGENARKQVHRIRSQHQAILVGNNTLRQDNPSLTVRGIKESSPVKVIIDPKNKLSKELNVFKHPPVLLLCSKKPAFPVNYQICSNFKLENLLFVLLTKFQIGSLLVEGGSRLISSFLKHNLFDYFYHFIAPFPLSKGIKMCRGNYCLDTHPVLTLEKSTVFDNDIMLKYKNKNHPLDIKKGVCLLASLKKSEK
ncbi:MAG: hypothetical protein APR63_12895 [Desulfuromonas sp. SDB]|nr:MAG: hypothetical protein APR63_12895 [Desulfuromonas sp. SDB]